MNRRTFIQRTEAAGAGLLLGAAQAGAQSRNGSGESGADKEIRNILLLFADQHRQDCLGCYGNPVVQTPNLDRLARTGIRFTNSFTPTPVCTPARTSVQTGQFVHHHRLMYNTGSDYGGLQDPDPKTTFFSTYLREKSWQLSHIGKWHIGTEKNKPSAHGYDEEEYYPGYGSTSRYPHYIEFLKTQGVDGLRLLQEIRDPTGTIMYAGLEEGPPSASPSAYLANQTIDTLRRFARNDSPFFLSCMFWGPHTPFTIPRKWYEMYDGAHIKPWPNLDCDLSDKPGVYTRTGVRWKTSWFTQETLPTLIGKSYGYISLIDEEIGRILKALEDVGKLDQTLIIYTVDHGCCLGSYRMWDKNFGMFDCMTRIPMIASHPSIRPGVSNTFVSIIDLAPTFLELAGCPIPKDMDGISLLPLLRGGSLPGRDEHIVTEHFGQGLAFWQRMVRTKHTKYVFNPEDRDEFYDLDTDPFETRNIINRVGKATLQHNQEILLQWMKDTKDPLSVWAALLLS